MDDETSLQFRVKSWNEQAAAGKITYQELEMRIRQAAESLDKDFSDGKLKWEEYEAQRAYLTMTDAASQSWRLFADGTWRQKIEKTWEVGNPDFSPPPVPKPVSKPASKPAQPLQPSSPEAASPQPSAQPSPTPATLAGPKPAFDREWAIAVAALVVLGILIVAGRLLLGPALFKPAPPSPTSPIVEVEATPTPENTATPEPPPPTSTPEDTPLPTATITSEPGVTPSTPPPPTFTPAPEAVPPTSTPVPPPAPTPYGVIAYAAFNEKATSYNVYLRAWPDLKVIKTIPDAGQPAALTNGSRLAFRSWNTNQQGISIMDLRSQATSQATGISEAMQPAWSPSGRLAFAANNLPDKKWHLYVDGQALPIDGSLEGPVWLGDERLAFHGCRAEGCGLFTASASGGDVRRLTTGNNDFNLAASPKGDQLAFTSDRAGGWDIFTIAADGSQAEPTRLTTGPAVEVIPAWSPDGQWIAFASDEGGKWGLWVIPAAGGETRCLFDMEGPPNGFVANGPPGQAKWLQQQQASWFQ